MLLGRTDERLALDRLLARSANRAKRRAGPRRRAGNRQDGAARLRAGARRGDARAAGAGRRVRGGDPVRGAARAAAPGARRARPDPDAAGRRARRRARAGARRPPATASRSAPRRSACCRRAPTISRCSLLVDDAHWLDASSAEALLFAARRLVADPIALVVTAREGEPSLLDGADLRTLRLAGLDRGDAAALLARSDVTGDLVDELHRATGGNPLALLELAADGDRLAAAPAAGPVTISASIAAAFLHRFGRLPEATRRVLVLAAASDGGDLAVLARAAPQLGLDVAELAPAEEAGLVSVDAGDGRVPPPAGARGGLRRGVARQSAARSTRRSPRRCPTTTSTAAPGTSRRRASAPTSGPPRRSSRPATGPATAAPTPSRRPPSTAAPGSRYDDDVRARLAVRGGRRGVAGRRRAADAGRALDDAQGARRRRRAAVRSASTGCAGRWRCASGR